MVQYTEAEKNRQAMANTQPNNTTSSLTGGSGYVATTVAPSPPVQRPFVTPKPRYISNFLQYLNMKELYQHLTLSGFFLVILVDRDLMIRIAMLVYMLDH